MYSVSGDYGICPMYSSGCGAVSAVDKKVCTGVTLPVAGILQRLIKMWFYCRSNTWQKKIDLEGKRIWMNFTFHNRSVVHLRLPEVNRQQVWLIQMIPDFAVDIGTQFRAPPIVSSINWSVCQTVKKKEGKILCLLCWKTGDTICKLSSLVLSKRYVVDHSFFVNISSNWSLS